MKRVDRADPNIRLNSCTAHISAMVVGFLVGFMVLNLKIQLEKIPPWKIYFRNYFCPLILATLFFTALFQHGHTAYPPRLLRLLDEPYKMLPKRASY